MVINLGYSKIPFKTKMSGGLEMEQVDREGRSDSQGNDDQSLFLQAKNTYFDMVATKLKYQYLNRDENFPNKDAGNVPTDATYYKRFDRRYDTASRRQHIYSISFDITPMEKLDVGLEYRKKAAEYPTTKMGLQSSKSHEIYSDATYIFGDLATLNVFVDYEKSTRKTQKRVGPTVNGDPDAPWTSTAYNWGFTVEDKILSYGVNIAFQLIEEELKWLISASRENVDGSQSFVNQRPLLLPDIDAWGDYKKDELGTNLIYTWRKNWDANLGYKYQHLYYDDISTNGYRLNTGTDIFTGAYNDSNYNANMIYLTATYRF
ncbi:MAG: MtrB/PioB family outer membrane beta-barrel protein [Pseudomonadota bacterium]